VPLTDSEAAGKVLYVWFDAVLGYISFTKEWAALAGSPDRWKEYWQNPDSRVVNFIGKDNVVFHTIMLPAILMAWNEGRNDSIYNLADNVPASEFMNFEGRKFSKSRNYAVYLGEFLEKFPAEALRYSIAMNYPETKTATSAGPTFRTVPTVNLPTRWATSSSAPLISPTRALRALCPIPAAVKSGTA